MKDWSELVEKVSSNLLGQKGFLSVVESCTGGGLSQALTSMPGASNWFAGGFVTYSNDAKIKHVFVRESTLHDQGAVSEDCVREMANGGMIALDCNCCLSISGVAGPDGGSEEKPVGTVWMGLAIRHKAIDSKCFHFEGDRQSVREQAIEKALEWLASINFKKTG